MKLQSNMDQKIKSLLAAARRVRQKAYCPYSGFAVGAALLSADNQIFTGCNVENASYGLTCCAERNAIFSMVAAGKQEFKLLVILGDTPAPLSPCGACRQVMAEFAAPECRIIMANLKNRWLETGMSELLPHGFALKNKE